MLIDKIENEHLLPEFETMIEYNPFEICFKESGTCQNQNEYGECYDRFEIFGKCKHRREQI